MPAVKGDGMRRLAVFISDIRNCKSKEAELKRINKELANIRSKFKGDKRLDGNEKMDSVATLLSIFLLGNDIDFGHMEAVNLLSSSNLEEKQIGYLFISVLIDQSSELMKLIIQGIKNDLVSRNPVHVNLALQCIANISSREMAEAFAPELPKLLISGDTTDFVKQSAALCLLKLFRTMPECINCAEYASRIVHLLNDSHMIVEMSLSSLIDTLSKKSPEDFKGCMSLSVSSLSRIVTSTNSDLQDTYFGIPTPWLCVKLLRLLQNYPSPEDPSNKLRLLDCLEGILNRAQAAPKPEEVCAYPDAKDPVLFEAISLLIHMDSEPNLLVRACNQLGTCPSLRETNQRYLALESMCLLGTSEFSHAAVKKHQDVIINALKTERDVSVRQRAVDLLYAMCDRTNASETVAEMLTYLETADYSIREEMVLKVAILTEKYATDYTWHVDVILKLIRIAGDYVSEDVWYRVIQIVVNREDVQGYAAKTCFEALKNPFCHENMVKVGSYILGEFGNLIAGDQRSSPSAQFRLLHSKYRLSGMSTRSLLLTAYLKFCHLFPAIKPMVRYVLQTDHNLRNPAPELLQRAVEYLALSKITSADVLATVLEEMPPFAEKESWLLAKLKKSKPQQEEENAEKEKKARPSAVMANNSSSSTGVVSGSLVDVDTAQKEKRREEDSLSCELADLKMHVMGLEPRGRREFLDIMRNLIILGQENDSSSSTGVVSGSLVDVDTAQKESTLSDVFQPSPAASSDRSSAEMRPASTGGDPDVFNSSDYLKFVTKNNGILYEDDNIQIGCKLETRSNMGRLVMFYENKTGGAFRNMSSSFIMRGAMGEQLFVKPGELIWTLDEGCMANQVIKITCVDLFTRPLIMKLQYKFNDDDGLQRSFDKCLYLPIFINKFFEPLEMTSEQFFNRWNALPQEAQKIFPAKNPMEKGAVRTKLAGLGNLNGVDPNPENYACAGFIHTQSQQIGALVRLEPNAQAKMYRLTIRSSKDTVSKQLVELISTQF